MAESIYYHTMDKLWVQSKRFAMLRNYFAGEFDLQDITHSFSLRKFLGPRFYSPLCLSCWRMLLQNQLDRKLDLSGVLACVTSHYNIGGGLNPEKAIPAGISEEAAFSQAIDILSRCKGVLVNSMRLYDLLSQKIAHLFYAPNGIDTNFFRPGENAHSFNRDHIRIGWVGKFKAAKNYELLSELKTDFGGLGIELVEIGLAKGEKNILSSDGMLEFYRGLDFYLCTSWHEGTPNPCLEAAACGVPLITTRVGNMPELVRDGENSFFIDPNRASVLEAIDRVKALSQDKYAEMSRTLRADIEKEWDWNNRMEPYRQAFACLAQS